MKKNETIQNYVEAIHILSIENEKVRAIDIANYLNFSRATVSVALKQLEEEKYLTVKDNYLYLTAKGKKVADKMYERHVYIAELLIKLGVSKKQAYEDSCLVEHDLSEESFLAIKKATQNI